MLLSGLEAHPLLALLPQRVGPAKLGLVLAEPARAAVILGEAAVALSAVCLVFSTLVLFVTKIKIRLKIIVKLTFVILLFALAGHELLLLFILLVVGGLHVSGEADGPGVGEVAQLAGVVLGREFLLALLQVNFSVVLPQNGRTVAREGTFLAGKRLHLAIDSVKDG